MSAPDVEDYARLFAPTTGHVFRKRRTSCHGGLHGEGDAVVDTTAILERRGKTRDQREAPLLALPVATCERLIWRPLLD
ncbi:hypothetical protein MRX96_005336 [Rhipicephalus microplus]